MRRAGGRRQALAMAVALLSAATAALAAPPDLSGVWQLSGRVGALHTSDGGAPPLTPAARAVYEAHRTAAAHGDYSFDGVTRCLPPGLPRLMLMREPFEILQRDKVVYFLHQLNRLPRRVYLDEPLPTDVDPHYLGYSVARWDGDTLVVESTGFDDSTLLDNAGLPHSEELRLTERYRESPDGRHLSLRFTILDPKTFTRPWSAQVEYSRHSGYRIPEDVCSATAVADRPRD